MGSRNMTLILRSSPAIPKYVVDDNCQIFGQTLSVLDSIMLLIAIYYVFDLEYPTMYVQMVGIIQHWVVGDAYTEQKCTNFIKFSDMLSKSSDKPDISE
jgi:hypothetical protein